MKWIFHSAKRCIVFWKLIVPTSEVWYFSYCIVVYRNLRAVNNVAFHSKIIELKKIENFTLFTSENKITHWAIIAAHYDNLIKNSAETVTVCPNEC